MLISGETARYELTHLKSGLFGKTSILPVAAERVNIDIQTSVFTPRVIIT